ncbi:Vacuolar protein-sorting-associated protein 24 [Ascosphaera acerosa]|nr:Vacuolar protein-sorting-associated protein 24 [Ascosphaera acerosa]
MESLKAVFFGPDPAAQMRKCNALIRANTRKLDRDIAQLKLLESRTRQHIVQSSKRAERAGAGQAGGAREQAARDARVFARELVRVRRQHARLTTSRAQLESVRLRVNEAFSVRKIEGSLRASTGVMRDVNQLVRLPQLEGTMRQLSVELAKAGIIEETISDALPDAELAEDEMELADAEVDKVLAEVLHGKLEKIESPAALPTPAAARVEEEEAAAEEEEEEDHEATLAQMRGRLEALKS